MGRKLLCFMMVLIIACSVTLIGCEKDEKVSTDNGEKESTVKTDDKDVDDELELIEYTILVNDASKVPAEDNVILKRIEEDFKIKFKFDAIVGDTDTKLGIMIASGDYPDIIGGIDSADKLMNAGVYQPLEDLIEEHAPRLKTEYYGDDWQKCHMEDGHIYLLPYERIKGEYNPPLRTDLTSFWIQKDVLVQAGYPKITTVSEYFDLLEEYKKNNPQIDGKDTIPFEILTYDWRRFCLLNVPALAAGYPNDGGYLVDPKENQDADAYTLSVSSNKPIAKQLIQTYNDAYNRGLIDPESFTMNYDQYLAKLSSGRVLGMYDAHWQFWKAEEALIRDGKIERTWVQLPLVLDDSMTPRYGDLPTINVGRGMGVSKTCENVDRLLKFAEATMTDEWQTFIRWGTEGEDYYVDDNGRFRRTPEQVQAAQTEEFYKKKTILSVDTFFPTTYWGTMADGNSYRIDEQPEEYYAKLTDYEKSLLDAYGYKTWNDFIVGGGAQMKKNPIYYPAWDITIPEGTEAKIAEQKNTDLKAEYYAKAIIASPDEFETVWDEFQTKLNKVNLKALEDEFTKQIQWRMENWK